MCNNSTCTFQASAQRSSSGQKCHAKFKLPFQQFSEEFETLSLPLLPATYNTNEMPTSIELKRSGLVQFEDFRCKFLAMSSHFYDYRPLETPTHIRILHLRYGDEAKPLRCIIEHVDLEQRPSYQAISYVWGNSDKPFRIETEDGSYIRLTASLRDALKDLQSTSMAGCNTFWADAICIYVYRHRKKSLRNLRFGRPFSEGVLFPSRINKPPFIRLRDALPILYLDPCILTMK